MAGKSPYDPQTRKRRAKLHSVWNQMKQRCRNPKDSHYPRYGARGIEVRWANGPTSGSSSRGQTPTAISPGCPSIASTTMATTSLTTAAGPTPRPRCATAATTGCSPHSARPSASPTGLKTRDASSTATPSSSEPGRATGLPRRWSPRHHSRTACRASARATRRTARTATTTAKPGSGTSVATTTAGPARTTRPAPALTRGMPRERRDARHPAAARRLRVASTSLIEQAAVTSGS